MQVKRNSVVVVLYRNAPRLALVRSLRPRTNQVNVMISLFKRSNLVTDWLIDPSEIVETTSLTSSEYWHLSTCYPNPNSTSEIGRKMLADQAIADAAYPRYAAFRQHYEDYPYRKSA